MVSGSFIQHCGKCPEEILSGQGRCLVSKVYINREEKPARGERACGFPEKGGDHVGEATSETDPRAHLERSQEWAGLESLLGGPHQPGHFPASLPFPHCHQQDLPQEKKKKQQAYNPSSEKSERGVAGVPTYIARLEKQEPRGHGGWKE